MPRKEQQNKETSHNLAKDADKVPLGTVLDRLCGLLQENCSEKAAIILFVLELSEAIVLLRGLCIKASRPYAIFSL